MRVTAINSQNNRLSYKGLWGDTITRQEELLSKRGIDIYNCETKEYFPFCEESLQSVNDLMKANTTYRVIEENESGDKFSRCRKHEGTDIRVHGTLLFTTKQWINYITNKIVSGSVECNLIENNLRKLHLERYLRA